MSNELVYLLNLLDDPADEVFNAVEKQMVGFGKSIVSELEQYWELNSNILVQRRIEKLIQKINFIHLKKELSRWIINDSGNLLYGSYLVSLMQYPELEFEEIESVFNECKRDLWLEMNNNLTALEKIRVLNHVFFQVHNFQGAKKNGFAPQYYFINNLLNSKKGNQYSLAMLYASLAQSVDLPVFGLKIPNNYLLAYHDAELAKYVDSEMAEILFYINPHNLGAIFGSDDLSKMFKQYKIPSNKEFFHPSDNVFFIKQVFNALTLSFQHMGYTDKVAQTESIIRYIDDEIKLVE